MADGGNLLVQLALRLLLLLDAADRYDLVVGAEEGGCWVTGQGLVAAILQNIRIYHFHKLYVVHFL